MLLPENCYLPIINILYSYYTFCESTHASFTRLLSKETNLKLILTSSLATVLFDRIYNLHGSCDSGSVTSCFFTLLNSNSAPPLWGGKKYIYVRNSQYKFCKCILCGKDVTNTTLFWGVERHVASDRLNIRSEEVMHPSQGFQGVTARSSATSISTIIHSITHHKI